MLGSRARRRGSGWLAQGRPDWTGRPLVGFEEWSRIAGGILAVAGVDGFLDNSRELLENADPDADTWCAFVDAWAAEHGEAWTYAGELTKLALAGLSPTAAARAAGVDRVTVWHWRQQPDFALAELEARAALVERLADDALADAAESAAVLRESPKTLYRVAMDGIRERLMPGTATLTGDVNGPREVKLEWPT
jgi:hypothetical protein